MSTLTSIIILTHNKKEVTSTCLPTLLRTRDATWELIVVDNGSTDNTREWLKDFTIAAAHAGIRVSLIENAGNIGCSTARNQGAARATGDRLVFMDNDVALRSRFWLRELGKRLEDPEVAIAGPKLVYPFSPHDIQCAGVGISRTGRVLFRGRGDSRLTPDLNREIDVQCMISACFMVRRSAFEQAGGFDEAFNPVEFEDFDLCYRIRERGNRIVYVPAVEMYHFESVTTAGTASLPNTYLIIKNGLLFKKRWQHMFASENGPPDEQTRWKKLKTPAFADIGNLPTTD